MQSKAKTVTEYIKSLPEDRRKEISTVRTLVKKNLPKGYEETMLYGMISYVVPLAQYPAGYRDDKKTPLTYVGLASQKNYLSLYILTAYADPKEFESFKKTYDKSGKKLVMGKSCITFRKSEDLAMDVIGKTIAKVPVKKFIATYEAGRSKLKSRNK